MTMSKQIRRNHNGEEGYMLVAVIFILAIFMLTMTIAAPKIKQEIQRDRDVETMHRGKQYIRAIRLYYRKFNAYPPNIDALVKTNEIRFLRKKYVDPTTGKAEWKPIQFGQNKCPIVYGFFGQAIGGASIAGTGPSGGNGGPGQNPGDPSSGGTGSGGTGSGDPGSGGTGSGGTGTGGTGAGGTGPGAPGSGFSGQTFGGAGIIGFAPMSPKQSIYVYKKKNHYNEWEFTYDPMMERMQLLGGSGAGAGGNQNGFNPIGGSNGGNPGAGTGTGGTGTGGTGTGGTGTGTGGTGTGGTGGVGSSGGCFSNNGNLGNCTSQ
jgi:type II secretory pathway pseudopilin PulG